MSSQVHARWHVVRLKLAQQT